MKNALCLSAALLAAALVAHPIAAQTDPTPPTTRPAANGQSGRAGRPMGRPPADRPSARTDPNSRTAHEQLVQKAKQGRIDVYFLGDSITRRWGATDYPDFLANWKQNFFGWNAGNFGWGGDATQNILWRIQNGELDGVNPKVIVLMAGTNNVGSRGGTETDADNIAGGIKAILDTCQQKAPNATIILTAIFPRNDNMDAMRLVTQINDRISRFADGKKIRFLNVNSKMADAEGNLLEGITTPDKLHLQVKGYQVWADGLKPILTELLGPPAAVDQAPPPTGDPSRPAATTAPAR